MHSLKHGALLGLSLLAAACTSGPRARANGQPREELLESGGEIDLTALPASTISQREGEVTAWGLVEVPGDARLQAAFAIADADARAELVASMRVGIASSLEASASASSTSTSSTTSTTTSTTTSPSTRTSASTSAARDGADSQEVREETAQVAQGVLPTLSTPRHGWQRVRRDGAVLLRVCARISAREEELARALAAGLKGAPDPAAQAREVLARLGAGRALEGDR